VLLADGLLPGFPFSVLLHFVTSVMNLPEIFLQKTVADQKVANLTWLNV